MSGEKRSIGLEVEVAGTPEEVRRARITLGSGDSPRLAGTVVDAASWRLALLVDEPAPGTAFVAAEGTGPQVGVSIWAYLYGDEGREAVDRDDSRWQEWLGSHAR